MPKLRRRRRRSGRAGAHRRPEQADAHPAPGATTENEKSDVVNWIVQRIRCLARIPEERAPTELEMFVATTMMLCLIVIIDNPKRPDDDGAAFFDLSEIAVSMDIILITPSAGRAFVRKVSHELAQRLMIAEVAAELFWASEVHIEGPGWDNERERHKLAVRVEDQLVCEESEGGSARNVCQTDHVDHIFCND